MDQRLSTSQAQNWAQSELSLDSRQLLTIAHLGPLAILRAGAAKDIPSEGFHRREIGQETPSFI